MRRTNGSIETTCNLRHHWYRGERKECERLVNEAIEKTKDKRSARTAASMCYTGQQQQYGMAYGQQAAAAPVNVYGGAPQTAQVYGAAWQFSKCTVRAVPQQQQPQQQQQLMQQYQQYYGAGKASGHRLDQEYDPSQPQAVAAAAASDWATYYSEGPLLLQ